MVVRVKFNCGDIKLFKNVLEVSNLSTKYTVDYLRIICFDDLPNYYTLIDFSDISCFEVRSVLCAKNMYRSCSSSECINCQYFDFKTCKCNKGGN